MGISEAGLSTAYLQRKAAETKLFLKLRKFKAAWDLDQQ
jgi:hypothetical protein